MLLHHSAVVYVCKNDILLKAHSNNIQNMDVFCQWAAKNKIRYTMFIYFKGKGPRNAILLIWSKAFVYSIY